MGNNDATTTAILAAIEGLRTDMAQRFDGTDARLDKLNGRVRTAETEITKIKTVTGAVAALLAFVGWPAVKLWLTSLTK